MSDACLGRTWRPVSHYDLVRVRLTRVGLAEFERQALELRAVMPAASRHRQALAPKLDAEGYYCTPLWVLMRRFGHVLRAGAELPWEGELLVEAKGDE